MNEEREDNARYSRQTSLIPQEKVANTPVTVIGLGAVGRQVSLQLAALGVRDLQLIDFDKVDWSNVAAQGFATSDVGREKIYAVAGAVLDHDPMIHVEWVEDRWRPAYKTREVVFCCVDSIAARASIWKGVRQRCRFWGDARMLGEVIRILSATDERSGQHYATTLFEPGQVQSGSCTARSTIYAATIAAGLLCHRFAQWLREDRLEHDVLVSLRSAEICSLASSP